MKQFNWTWGELRSELIDESNWRMKQATNSIGIAEWGPKELLLRGKRENGIQSTAGQAKPAKLMDGMNGGLLLFFFMVGYGPEAPLPPSHFIPEDNSSFIPVQLPILFICSRQEGSPLISSIV